MRVLFVASECTPFAKAGGLGDVVGALPKALRDQDIDARVLLPRYGFIDADGEQIPLAVPLGDGEAWCGVIETTLPGSEVPLYLLEHDALYDGPHIYPGFGGSDYEFARFVLLSRAAFSLSRVLEWTPDVLHLHDWPTAPAAIMLNTVESELGETASVLSIHNLAHQPRFPPAGIDLMHTGWDIFRSDGIEDHGQLNPFKGGLYHATMISTVSPTYAREIQTPEGGAGLHDVMKFRAGDLVGITNGIDEDVWDPATDPHLSSHFSADDLSGKTAEKAALQMELGLPVDPDVPLIGAISRMAPQKGIDLLAEALDRILGLGVQVAILGSGDPGLETALAARAGGNLSVTIGFSEALAHRIEGGADLFVMPSRFEPCGLNQMYSQRYGTLPIVRATGGLVDTVEPCDVAAGKGTGFSFLELSSDALADTVSAAVSLYRGRPAVFRAMQVRAMKKPFGWSESAKQYGELYRWALERKGR